MAAQFLPPGPLYSYVLNLSGTLPDQVVVTAPATASLTGTLSPPPAGSSYPYTISLQMLMDTSPGGQLTTSLSPGPSPLALSTQAIIVNGLGAALSTSTKDFQVGNGPDLILNIVPASGARPVVSANFAAVGAGLSGVFRAASYGAGSSPDGTTACCTQANGGKVTIEYGGNLGLQATSSGSVNNAQLFGLSAQSVGGYTDAQLHDGQSYGNGGAVFVHTQPGSIISLNVGSTNAPGSGALTTYGAIRAESDGFVPGWQDPYSLKNEQQVLGGPVTVVHEGAITGGSTGAMSATTGIVARSFGGSSFGESLNPFYGGDVSVEIKNSGSIALAGPNTTGVLAVSGTYQNYAPKPTGGAGPGVVTVNVDAGASVTTGTAGSAIGQFGFGVQAANISGVQQVVGLSAMPGSDAGPVNVSNGGRITTAGPLAVGIAAMSTPLYFTGAAAPSGANYLGATDAGAGGGNGGTVTVTNQGSITTTGGSAFGIFALSGAGGMMSLASASDGSGSGTTVIGNQASAFASQGGTVNVTNSGQIRTGGTGTTTDGIAAIGILAQSIGGGGGSTGGYHGYFTGDAGGAGGWGGSVNVTTGGASQVVTTGDGAQGILAQSIGGGGGNGASVSGVVVATGGKGGDGGFGGAVDLQLTGNGVITTSGHFADGVVGQSIGGGGGNGGASWAWGHAVTVSHGGKGGAGGWGGEVVFNSTNTITTDGDHATGVSLQSIGGGGGKGGAAITNADSIVTVAIAIGGSGGNGGLGFAVEAANTGSITTTGNDAIGLLAQSIGGGGGHGGSALSHAVSVPVEDFPAISISTAIGGSGGEGGNGGLVQIKNGGLIASAGDGAHGILAQSIGGGGGSGGDSAAVARSFTGGEGGSVNVAFALGGAGGSGGGGAVVSIDNTGGRIQTSGALASAIVAQSIGGGGGNGAVGFAKTAGTPLPPTGSATVGTAAEGEHGEDEGEAKSYSLALGIGGAAGNGGDGGQVSVTNAYGAAQAGGSIQTVGSGAHGILAQSIGGGGGNGGGGGTTGGTDITLNINVGRSGGGGGDGGSVAITNNGAIATGGLVTTASGLTVTLGGDAVGILAQSIGGGGGIGGSSDPVAPIAANNVLDDLSKALDIVKSYQEKPSASYAATVQVGGSGGHGGDGGQITVSNGAQATVTTVGARAHGIFAQSIGGAGGIGASAESSPGVNIEVEPEGNNTKYTTDLIVGTGGAGAFGSGGNVTVANAGTIVTAGYGAIGALLQSVGAGGGYAAEGTVANNVVTYLGSFSNWGVMVVSGNNGGTVTFTDTGQAIATAGDDAHAVVAQSIGGGGGIASVGCTNSAGASVGGVHASPCYGNNVMDGNDAGAWHDGSRYTVILSGFAYNATPWGGINNGGAVTVTENGRIATAGSRSIGIIAQSIGGGGGLQTMAAGSINKTELGIFAAPDPSVGFPLASPVKVVLGGSITTTGDGAWGILAQSLGGGGGFVGDPALPLAVQPVTPVGISESCCAPTNNVSITSAGSIVTSGVNAHGIVAQSIGGGGGAWVQAATSSTAAQLALGSIHADTAAQSSYNATGGNVTITQTAGTISVTGAGAIGILAQSAGLLYNAQQPGNIAITVGGTVSGGSNGGVATTTVGGGAAGIAVAGGSLAGGNAPNLVTVEQGGKVTTQDGVKGTAIVANTYAGGVKDGVTDVVNNGTITGSVITTGKLTNNGTINAGTTMSYASFVNNGTYSTGGPGAVASTQHVGTLSHTAGSTMVIDIDALAPQKQDEIVVRGDASVLGTVVPVATRLLPGDYRYLTVEAGSGTLQHAATVRQGAVFAWQTATTATSAALVPTPNFRPSGLGLGTTATSLTAWLDRSWQAADRGLAGTFGYLSQLSSAGSYAGWLQAASGEALTIPGQILLQGTAITLGAVMGCDEFVGAGTVLTDGSCAWASVGAGKARQDATSGNIGYDANDYAVRIGGQMRLSPSWYAAGSFGYSDGSASTAGFSTSVDSYALAGSLKYSAGPWELTGALSLTWGAADNRRTIDVASAGLLAAERGTATSTAHAYQLGARLRAAWELPLGMAYLRPYADLDVYTGRVPGYSESGTSLALSVQSTSQTRVAFSPMLQIGGRYDLDGGFALRPYANLGASFLSDDTVALDASLATASGSGGTFRIAAQVPRTLGNAEVGVHLYGSDKFELKALYAARFGSGYLAQGGLLRLSTAF